MAQVSNSKPIVSYFLFIVGMMMAVFPQATVQKALAAQDAASLASGATGIAAGAVGIASMDSGYAVEDCSCKAAGGADCSPTPWTTCAALGIAVVGIVGAAASMVMSQSSHDASVSNASGGGYTVKKFDPDKPLAPQLGCSMAECCSDPKSSISPVCSPAALKNLPGELENAKSLLAAGTIKPQDGKTVDETMAEMNAASAQASQMAEGIIPDSSGVTASQFAGDPSNTNGGKGRLGAGSAIEGNGSGGGSGSDYGASKSTAGPADRSGLGATLWNGKLDMIDDATGRSLTLWQRATRRYQGEQGKRAFMLARTEGLRMNRFLTIKKTANPPVAQATPPKAAAPAPAATRKPASLRLH